MAIVTIHEAKTHLSKLLARVEAGEEIVIARNKEPVARLVALKGTGPKRTFGAIRGTWPVLPDDFWFAPLPEDEIELWETGVAGPARHA